MRDPCVAGVQTWGRAIFNGAGVTSLGGGVFTLTATSVADLAGLTITPANEFEGTVTVGVSAIASDGAAVSTAGTRTPHLFIPPTPGQPTPTSSSNTINQD